MSKPNKRTRIFWDAAQRMQESRLTLTLAIPQSALTPQGKNPFLCKAMMPIHSSRSVASCGTAIHLCPWMCANWRQLNLIQTFGVKQ